MRYLAAALIMLAVCAAPARADVDEELERYTLAVTQCVAGAERSEDLRNCRGVGAQPCMEADGGTTHGMVMCISAEGDAWDRIMADAIARLHAEQGETTEALDDAQLAWRSYLEAECSYRVARWGLGSGGRVELASCNASLTADRAIALVMFSRTRD